MLSNDDAARDAHSMIQAALIKAKAEAIRSTIFRMNELRPLLNDIIAEASRRVAMLRLPHCYLCEKFSELAKIPDAKRHQFNEHVAKELTRWFCAVIFHSGGGSAAPILAAMKRNLTDVYEKLANPNEAVSADLHLRVWMRLSFELEDSSVADMLEGVEKSIAAIERALARGHERRGPSPGVSQYPEVDTLVFFLEFGAQLAGGKFTAHKIRNGGGKGTMIEALNFLRTALPTKLAEAIPLADQHPISTYKRAINQARKAGRQADLVRPIT
jgi:hypothetical protein